MTLKPATTGNSERCSLQVGFGFAGAMRAGKAEGCKHLPLVPKVACLNPAIVVSEIFVLKPIPKLNPKLKHLELMPKRNLKHLEM
jgi:hypothetical protein